MKKIIIIGVCLVTAAIVYGFVDYLKTDKKKLQRMYGDEPASAALPAPAAKSLKTPITSPPPKPLDLELYSRAALDEKYIAPATAKQVTKRAASRKQTDTTTIFTKLDPSLFSRGSLRKRKPVVADTAITTVVREEMADEKKQ